MPNDRAILETIGRLKQTEPVAPKKKKPTQDSAVTGLVSGIEESLKDTSFKGDSDTMRIPVTTYVTFLEQLHKAKKTRRAFKRSDGRR